jgi:hypothetical protein
MKDIARELLKIARDILADRLKDEIGIDGRTLFKATQEAIDNWLDQNDYLEISVEIDYTTSFSGRYWKGNYDNPPEYPEMDLEMDEATVDYRKGKSIPLRELVRDALQVARRRDVDPVKVTGSSMAMRTIRTAIDKWSYDVETPVFRSGDEMYELPKGIMDITAKLAGTKVVFVIPKIDPDDLEQKTWDVANKDWDKWADVPERDY